MRTHEVLSSDMELLVVCILWFCGEILSCAYPGIYEIDYFTSLFGGSCISKKKENAQRYDT